MTENEEMHEVLNKVRIICQKINCGNCPCMDMFCKFLVRPCDWEFDTINQPVYKMKGNNHDR